MYFGSNYLLAKPIATNSEDEEGIEDFEPKEFTVSVADSVKAKYAEHDDGETCLLDILDTGKFIFRFQC